MTRLSTSAAQMFLIFLAVSEETVCSPETCRSTAPEQESRGGKYSQREKKSMERFAAFLVVIAISRPYKNTISVIAKKKNPPYFNCLQAPWRWRDISGSRFVLFLSSTTTSRSLSLRLRPVYSRSVHASRSRARWKAPVANLTSALTISLHPLSPSSPCTVGVYETNYTKMLYLILPCRSEGKRCFGGGGGGLWGLLSCSLMSTRGEVKDTLVFNL